MDINGIESSLTPAARQVLDEILNDYRREVLLHSRESAARLTGDVREIAVHDVVNALDQMRRRGLRNRSISCERVLIRSLIVGCAMAISLVLFIRVFGITDSTAVLDFILGLTLGVSSGCLAALIAVRRRRLPVLMRSENECVESDDSARLLLVWAEIEQRLRALAASQFGESAASRPLSTIIQELVDKSLVDESESRDITTVLRARNAVAHGQLNLRTSAIRHLLNVSARLATRLDERNSSIRLKL
jgi:hypothetical protein